jgi:hypothetical protein
LVNEVQSFIRASALALCGIADQEVNAFWQDATALETSLLKF